MKKTKIFSIAKSNKHYSFSTGKSRQVINHIRTFLQELGFTVYEVNQILNPMGDSDNNYSAKKYSSKLYTDKYFCFINRTYKIDVFFGKSKILLSIFTESNKQAFINKNIFKYFYLDEKIY